MEQKFLIVNVDKKEVIDPAWQSRLHTRLEDVANSENYANMALMNKLLGDWKGDRVYVVGENAVPRNASREPCIDTMNRVFAEFQTNSLYDYADKNFKRIPLMSLQTIGHDYRYIYNHEKKVFIDLERCPIEWCTYNTDFKSVRMSYINPLPLLISMGANEYGFMNKIQFSARGGREEKYVGSWGSSIQSVEVRKDRIPGHEYKIFTPNFTRYTRETYVPVSRADELKEEVIAATTKYEELQEYRNRYDDTPTTPASYHYQGSFGKLDGEKYFLDLVVRDYYDGKGYCKYSFEGTWDEIRQAAYGLKYPAALPTKEDMAKYGDQVVYVDGCSFNRVPIISLYSEQYGCNMIDRILPSDLQSDYYAGLHNDHYLAMRHDEPVVTKAAKKDRGER